MKYTYPQYKLVVSGHIYISGWVKLSELMLILDIIDDDFTTQEKVCPFNWRTIADQWTLYDWQDCRNQPLWILLLTIRNRFRSMVPTNLYGQNDNFNPSNSHLIPAIMHRFHDAKKPAKKSGRLRHRYSQAQVFTCRWYGSGYPACDGTPVSTLCFHFSMSEPGRTAQFNNFPRP